MADNFAFTPGSGAEGAADDIGGVLYPRVKLTWGPDGSANDADTASGKALPVQLRDSTGTEIVPLTTSDFDTKIGDLTETAPASDTDSSGLNGRLQRIAQRLTSLIALLPTALGAGGGLKVDGSGTALPVSGTVTANAGSNLNTSALALETGGNLQTIAGAISSSKMATKAASGDFADGAIATIGAKADAKSTATDTTAITAMQVWKQISASVQAIASSIAGTLTIGLPSGASTAANQTTGNTSVGNIDTNAGATSDAAVAAGASGSISAKLRRATQGLEDLKTLIVLAAGTNILGKVGIDQTTPGTTNGVTPVPATSGGPTVQRVKAAASTNATSVKASAGQLYGYALFNNTAAAKYFKLYNKASSPTVGTDTPLFTIIIPANGGANVSWDFGIPFGTGIAFAITGAVADSDTTSVSADDVHGVLLYK